IQGADERAAALGARRSATLVARADRRRSPDGRSVVVHARCCRAESSAEKRGPDAFNDIFDQTDDRSDRQTGARRCRMNTRDRRAVLFGGGALAMIAVVWFGILPWWNHWTAT